MVTHFEATIYSLTQLAVLKILNHAKNKNLYAFLYLFFFLHVQRYAQVVYLNYTNSTKKMRMTVKLIFENIFAVKMFA